MPRSPRLLLWQKGPQFTEQNKHRLERVCPFNRGRQSVDDLRRDHRPERRGKNVL
jgi:hypothetical protein